MTFPSFIRVNSTVSPWSTDTTGPGTVPLKTIALYITPPGCRALSGATGTSTSLAIIVTFFVLPVGVVSCASALKGPSKGLNTSPASRIPAAIPIITGLFVILAIENYLVIKKHCFLMCFLLITLYEDLFIYTQYIKKFSCPYHCRRTYIFVCDEICNDFACTSLEKSKSSIALYAEKSLAVTSTSLAKNGVLKACSAATVT